MKTSYKVWYITRDNREADGTPGLIQEVSACFYEGEVSKKTEDIGPDASPTEVTRYRCEKQLTKAELPHFASKGLKKTSAGEDAILFKKEDFGDIRTDEELEAFLNAELKKDTAREHVLPKPR